MRPHNPKIVDPRDGKRAVESPEDRHDRVSGVLTGNGMPRRDRMRAERLGENYYQSGSAVACSDVGACRDAGDAA